MFDLEKEVNSWTAAVAADRCAAGTSAAELADHLYCEIERARAAGQSDAQAFATAVARMGSTAALSAEHAKNDSRLATGCAVMARLERVPAGRAGRRLLIAHAILWAALIVACALLLKTSPDAKQMGTWLILLMTGSWLASERILRRAMRAHLAPSA